MDGFFVVVIGGTRFRTRMVTNAVPTISTAATRMPPKIPPTMGPALTDCAGTVEGSGLMIVNSIMGGIALGALLPTEDA